VRQLAGNSRQNAAHLLGYTGQVRAFAHTFEEAAPTVDSASGGFSCSQAESTPGPADVNANGWAAL
jgi:hypothetical protein